MNGYPGNLCLFDCLYTVPTLYSLIRCTSISSSAQSNLGLFLQPPTSPDWSFQATMGLGQGCSYLTSRIILQLIACLFFRYTWSRNFQATLSCYLQTLLSFSIHAQRTRLEISKCKQNADVMDWRGDVDKYGGGLHDGESFANRKHIVLGNCSFFETDRSAGWWVTLCIVDVLKYRRLVSEWIKV
jgi:hypothetical protein